MSSDTAPGAGSDPASARPASTAAASTAARSAARSAPAAPLTAFGMLRISGFLVLYVNAAVVFLGVMAQTIARGWLAFELTGSNAALGGVLLAFGVAMLVATPWGGVAADRLPKRLVLQVSVLLLALSSAWIGLAVAFGVIEYWMLPGAAIVQAIGFALFNPARMAFLAEPVRSSAPTRSASKRCSWPARVWRRSGCSSAERFPLGGAAGTDRRAHRWPNWPTGSTTCAAIPGSVRSCCAASASPWPACPIWRSCRPWPVTSSTGAPRATGSCRRPRPAAP